MYIFVLTALLIAEGSAAPPRAGTPLTSVRAEDSRDLMSAFRAAQIAEIYRISPDIQFVAAPTPDVTRSAGCRYLVARPSYDGDTAAWRDLERSLLEARITATASDRRPEARIGIVLSDWQGTLWEVYSDDLSGSSGQVDGLQRGRMVRLPISFAKALEGFIARHPELMDSDLAKTSRCPATGARR
jgi:hypothetical protein